MRTGLRSVRAFSTEGEGGLRFDSAVDVGALALKLWCLSFYIFFRSGKQLAANVVFILANFAWTSCCSIFVFGGLRCIHRIRVTERVETIGIDVSEHGARKDEEDFQMKVEGTAPAQLAE